jgi:hypothetical protein
VHPFGDLSAYLDSALSSEAQASVQAHLDTCALCRTRLAELRGTARLIKGLPMPVPSRSLVPRVSIPFWLAPLRTFSTFASGAAIFLFVASAVLSVFPRAMSQSAAPAGMPAASAAADAARGGATSATATPDPSLGDQQKIALPASPSGSPGAAFNVGAPSAVPAPAERSAAQSDPATPSPGLALSTPSAGLERVNYSRESGQPPFNPFPWLWLVLGLAFAGLSFVLGRRLRSA